MQKTRLFSLLEIVETDDIEIIYRAARRLAYEIHPDRHPGLSKLWSEFEPIWDSIRVQKKAGNSKFIYPGFSSPQSSQSGDRAHETRTSSGPQKGTKNGADIHVTVKIKFDEIVEGCQKSVQVPNESSLFEADHEVQFLSFEVTPTPLWLNKDGSVSARARSDVFKKKVVIKGAGSAGFNFGENGDLVVNFDVDIAGSRSGSRLLQEQFEEQIRLINEAFKAKEKAFWEEYMSNSGSSYSKQGTGASSVRPTSGPSSNSEPELKVNWGVLLAYLGGIYLIVNLIINARGN
jgi:DnaJ-class molecular chaperone